jgi:glycosyltransferase involved in cell wall biosynthesis
MNDGKQPLISVLVAVHNQELSVEAALRSILMQSYTNLELIIVDDCSLDTSKTVLKRLSNEDSRVKLLTNSKNEGLARSLNKALDFSSGNFVARMDADDYSYPHRFETQIKHLLENPDIELIGSNAELVDATDKVIGRTNLPITHEEIVSSLPKINPIVHPSVLARRSFFEKVGGYDPHLRKVQDYDLWSRGSLCVRYANLSECLLRYRVSESKPFKNDLYVFRVRLRNGRRGGYVMRALYWALIVLGTSMLRRVGYKQGAVR